MSELPNLSVPGVEVEAPKKLVNFSLPVMLGLAILVSLLIVAAGFLLYSGDPNRKYDIVRPDLKNQNQALSVETTEETLTTPISQAAASEKLQFLEKEAELLKNMNNFAVEVLNDQNIGLTPSRSSAI